MGKSPNEILTSDLLNFKHRINWEISYKCNFDCSYCPITELQKTPEPQIKSPQEIANAFNRTQLEWLILITGGEPFLYPNFISICEELTKNHIIQITTNLSTNNIVEFSNLISPDRVFNISASYHIEQRNERGLNDDFIKKCKLLQSKGFNILVNFIVTPFNASKIEGFVNTFKNLGIGTFCFAFRGEYNGKIYPQSYTKHELEVLKKFAIDDTEVKVALNQHSYYGKYCNAGKNYFAMDRFGNISRCFTLPKKTGNLFDNKFTLSTKPAPCIATKCNDYCHVEVSGNASTRAINREKRKYNKL